MALTAKAYFRAQEAQPTTESEELDSVAWEAVTDAMEAYDEFVNKLDNLKSLEEVIEEMGGVNRTIAASFEAHGFETFDFETFPLTSFTEQVSAENLDLTKKLMSKSSGFLIGAGLAALAVLIAKFVKWLKGRGSDHRDLGETLGEFKDTTAKAKNFDREVRDKKDHVEQLVTKVDKIVAAEETDSGKDKSSEVANAASDLANEILTRDKMDEQPTPKSLVGASPALLAEKFVKEVYDNYDRFVVGVFNHLGKKHGDVQFGFIRTIVESRLDQVLAEILPEYGERLDVHLNYMSKAFLMFQDPNPLTPEERLMYKNYLVKGWPADRTAHLHLLSVNKRAEEILQLFETHKQDEEMDPLPPLSQLSPTLARGVSDSNASVVRKEVETSLAELSRLRFRVPRVILGNEVNQFEAMGRVYETYKDLDLPKDKREILEAMNRDSRRLIESYHKLDGILSLARKQVKSISGFVDGFDGAYREVLESHMAAYVRACGLDRDGEKKLKELLKSSKLV